ncbi:MAG: hypothetical protein M0Z61_15420 [Nitrospiraceae bacterium]|nr:hypothetical protein [Nitrospiraceae bacterium]
MVNSVSTATSTEPASQPKPVEANAKVTTSKPQQAPNETVSISSAAQKALSAAQSALKELTETQAETTKEANTGDLQAKRLLAKEAAEKAAMQ